MNAVDLPILYLKLFNSLYKIYSKLGYNVVRINHLGDWGTQFGKLIVAYKLWGDKQTIVNGGVDELVALYVKFHEEAEKDEEYTVGLYVFVGECDI